MTTTSSARFMGLCATLTLGGCYEGMSSFDADGPGPASDEESHDDAHEPGASPDSEAQCRGEPLEIGPSSMLRLTREQYGRALRDLLGTGALADELAGELPGDERLGAFTVNASSVPLVLADVALRNAEAAADDFVDRLASALPCSEGAADRACGEGLVDRLGPRAFRRPMEPAERERLLTLFDEGALESFAEGVHRVVTAVVASPNFLYRIEVGTGDVVPGERFRLSGYEVATRMSLLLWGTIPDNTLLEAASQGGLDTAEGRREHAQRMLADPRARDSVGKFHLQWLGVESVASADRDPDIYPEFDPALAQSIVRETKSFAEHVVFEDDASFETLMTAAYTVADDAVLRLYGVEPSPTRDPEQPVELDPQQRSGLLTQAGFLAATSHRDQASPIKRGVDVRTHLLCQGLPPPPDDVDSDPPPVGEGTTRERFEARTSAPECAGCHELINPIGFGLSHYDALGRYQITENGQTIDATGELVGADDATGPFEGGVELSARLSQSVIAQRCYAEQWLVFASGRAWGPADACEFDRVYDQFSDSELDIQELLLSIVESPSFTHRLVADAAEPTEE